MFDQVRDAILPAPGLKDALDNWSAITQALSDTPRKRVRQTVSLKEVI